MNIGPLGIDNKGDNHECIQRINYSYSINTSITIYLGGIDERIIN